MHPELIRLHADQRLERLRHPRIAAGAETLADRFRRALAATLRAQAARLDATPNGVTVSC